VIRDAPVERITIKGGRVTGVVGRAGTEAFAIEPNTTNQRFKWITPGRRKLARAMRGFVHTGRRRDEQVIAKFLSDQCTQGFDLHIFRSEARGLVEVVERITSEPRRDFAHAPPGA
jgi:hypothetical protein